MIDWNDNAKAAVREFAGWLFTEYQYLSEVGKFIKQVEKQTQTKTVADAVGAFNGEWPNSRYDFAWWDSDTEQVLLGCNQTGDTICLRKEFEVYVKEQEGEKWTHKRDTHGLCRVLYEDERVQLIETEKGGRAAIWAKDYYAKPIKPTISESEAWRIVSEEGAIPSFIKRNYDVVKD